MGVTPSAEGYISKKNEKLDRDCWGWGNGDIGMIHTVVELHAFGPINPTKTKLTCKSKEKT